MNYTVWLMSKVRKSGYAKIFKIPEIYVII